MPKNINVIVKQTHANIGKKGSIVKLSAGYVFNYLIPNHIVEIPTKGKIKHLQMFNEIAQKKQDNLILNAKNIVTQIKSIKKIHITKKIGNKQSIFGRVNEKEILNEIFYQTNQKIEKKDIIVPDIKNIGKYHVKVKLLNNNAYDLVLQVVPNNI